MHSYITNVLVKAHISNELIINKYERSLFNAFFTYCETPGIKVIRDAKILDLPKHITKYKEVLDTCKGEQEFIQLPSAESDVLTVNKVVNVPPVTSVPLSNNTGTSIHTDIISDNKVIRNIEALKQYACKVVDVDEITYQRLDIIQGYQHKDVIEVYIIPIRNIYICMYIRMCVCMHVCICVCMHTL